MLILANQQTFLPTSGGLAFMCPLQEKASMHLNLYVMSCKAFSSFRSKQRELCEPPAILTSIKGNDTGASLEPLEGVKCSCGSLKYLF